MATNGASARQWLAEHGQNSSSEQLQRIRNAIANKLDALTDHHPDEPGLLEALDVMDEWIGRGTSTPGALPPAVPVFDTGSLTPDVPPIKQLSQEEKRARFKALLKTGHLPAIE